MTGPIYVNGAEPGDVLEIRILKITPKAFGTNFNLPGKEFPTIGALALRDAGRLRQVLLPRPRQEAG